MVWICELSQAEHVDNGGGGALLRGAHRTAPPEGGAKPGHCRRARLATEQDGNQAARAAQQLVTVIKARYGVWLRGRAPTEAEAPSRTWRALRPKGTVAAVGGRPAQDSVTGSIQ